MKIIEAFLDNPIGFPLLLLAACFFLHWAFGLSLAMLLVGAAAGLIAGRA